MGERREFVRLALEEGVNRRELCRRFGISPDIGYKWLARWEAGDRELADRSRRPHISPMRCNEAVETEVLGVRDAHPAWGRAKLWAIWNGREPTRRFRPFMPSSSAMIGS
ncbi:Putative partial transposase [Sinorhizobium meliloti 1021]|uniref:Partial transposase n=1 Tax=Rhizobium meliloti (strain 1021) TaxID=266834 RepID=Q92QQ7_RHIME|nr:Putative partial transposase [Sinorhizobium meliloti 1021]